MCVLKNGQTVFELLWLQEVYGKLEEPDGLSGLVRLRRGGPRLEDQVSFLPAKQCLNFEEYNISQKC